jgi:hypothetical protein
MTEQEIDKILSAISARQLKVETELSILNDKVSKIKQEYNRAMTEFEQKRHELDQFQRALLPKFSIVTYMPNSTEYYRASYRHIDPIQEKSIPRVVHLGPLKDYKGVDDPNLILLAKKQIIAYLSKKFPGTYDYLISKE